MNQVMNSVIQQLPVRADKDENIDVYKYVMFLFDNWLLIASVALAMTVLGVAYAIIAHPVYQADILIQVDDKATAARKLFGELSATLDLKAGAAPEMEILRSRAVVSRAVDNARLHIHVKPRYFPLIGQWIARHNQDLSTPGLFGYGGYVWGNEQAVVSVFNVPEAMERSEFTLIARGGGRFRLYNEEQGIDVSSVTGAPGSVHTPLGNIEIDVDSIVALPGARFSLVRVAREEAIEDLQDALKITELGKQSGVISVSLEGDDRKRITSSLNEMSREYVRQNTARTSEEAQKSFAFLKRQLPDLKDELEQSESRYNTLRSNRGTVDLDEENKTILRSTALAEQKMAELKERKEALLTRFQPEHPAIISVDQEIGVVAAEIAGAKGKLSRIPAVQQDVFRLTRDVKVNTELYTALLGTAQQLRLETASKVGTARVLDAAVTRVDPVKPRRPVVISVAVLLGLVLGIAAAAARKIFYRKLSYPHEIEQLLGMSVSATIPHNEKKTRLLERLRGHDSEERMRSGESSSEHVIESLRRFRTSLRFGMRNAGNNIILITGPTKGVGKSFISTNLATVLAATGNRVLLIDGDLRTGHLHWNFGLDRGMGLSEAVAGEIAPDQAISRNVVPNVDFISTGKLPARPAELLAGENLGRMLKRLSDFYDYVLVDTPPVLAVSDALVIAAHAGTTFNIVRADVSTVDEIEETVRRLNETGTVVTGNIFNDLKPRLARNGYTRYGNCRYPESA
jgi:tyrosine-protein kinase Etk/Wzc